MKPCYLPILALAACTAAPPPLPPLAADTCNAAQYAPLIGQDATALERVLLLDQVRVIRPGTMVTMDHRPARINFQIDDQNSIKSISCG